MSIIAEMCVRFQKFGISASVSQSTCQDSRIPHDSLSDPLGKLDIDGCPIRSVNVFQFRRTYEYDCDDFTVMYCVPDSRIIPGFRNVQLYSVRVKSFPFIGRVKAVEWQENDIELHLRKHLSQASFINATITATGKDFRVIAHPNKECWTIQTD